MRFALYSMLTVLLSVAGGLAQTVRFTRPGAEPVPFTIANNLVLVQASVGKAPAGWFILDTGAESTVLDSAYAAQTGLKQNGKSIGTGSSGTAVAGVMKGAKLTLGRLEATDVTTFALPLDSISAGLGMKLAGIIGNDVTGTTVFQIDYAGRTVTFYPPQEFRPPPGADVVPVTIEEHLPFLPADFTIGGKKVRGKMEIDTGSTGSVLFNAPFVTKNGLLTSITPTLGARAGGIGGNGSSRVGRIGGVNFGEAFIREPIAVLYTGTKGDNASSDYDGVLGGAIFRRFRMTIDIPGKRLFLEPNTSVGEPFETDMSGMDLLADGPDLGRIRVDDVKAASVAAKASVQKGDFLRSVNGRMISEIGLQEVRRMFRTPGEYDVELTRGRRVFSVHLKLVRVI